MNLLFRTPTCSKQFVIWAHLGHGAKQSSICRLVGLQVKLSPWRVVGFLAPIFPAPTTNGKLSLFRRDTHTMKRFSNTPIKLFACDIDGCLVAVKHAPYTLAGINELARLNQSSVYDSAVPALTLVTGRPHAYVDALMQLLDIQYPAIFENGAGLAFRHPYRAHIYEGLESGTAELRRFESLLGSRKDITFQVGKVASLSVFPAQEEDGIDALFEELQLLVDVHSFDLYLDPSHECINVLIPGMDKATGFQWLLRVTGLQANEVAGIGDSIGDVPWLRQCGQSCAPANCDPKMKTVVSFLSSQCDVEATLEFYYQLIETNRELLKTEPETDGITSSAVDDINHKSSGT
jgi:HAD superfamily hydrolase (TIGR01484 family)